MFRRLLAKFAGASAAGSVISHRLGTASSIVFSLPEGFHHEAESAADSFIMPRKNDQDGPVSLRMTQLQDPSDFLSSPELRDALPGIFGSLRPSPYQ
jgi:hypothetical protein